MSDDYKRALESAKSVLDSMSDSYIARNFTKTDLLRLFSSVFPEIKTMVRREKKLTIDDIYALDEIMSKVVQEQKNRPDVYWAGEENGYYNEVLRRFNKEDDE